MFERMWAAGLMAYDETQGIDWGWLAMDGATMKAPLGGDATRPNPTDRGKTGTKRSILTDARGITVGLAVAGAHRNDFKLVQETLDSMPVPPPPAESDNDGERPNRCLDKGYDYAEVRAQVQACIWSAHIRTRGEEKQAKRDIPGYRARRWVVERTHSWMNRFRRLLIRWEKKTENYVAMLHFACAWHAYRAAGVAV